MREGCRRGVLLGLTAASLLTSCDPEPPCARGSVAEDEADSAAMLRALAEAPRFSLQVRDAARNLRTLDYPKPAAPR